MSPQTDPSPRALREEAQRLLPDAVQLRRRLHARPELGLETPETAAALLEYLGDLDLAIAHSSRSSGFVATLSGGAPGRTLVLRADMDALPMPEDTPLDFRSEIDGRMHACGHDAHAAMLAAAARLLHRHRAAFRGQVRFFFQPGEEGHFGARVMLEEGLLDSEPTPSAAFAMHVNPMLRSGRVASKPGAVMAAGDVFSVELRGRGGHASMPQDAIDPIPAACEIVQALQSMVTRRVDVFDPAVVTVTRIAAGTSHNIIPESAQLVGTLRSTSERTRELVRAGLRRVATQIAAAHEVEARVHVVDGYPVTTNEMHFEAFVRDVAVELVGEGDFVPMRAPDMGAEDFSYLLQRWPGAMVFLGVRPDGTAAAHPCHSNRMMLDEGGMATGIALHAAVALRYLA